MAVFSVTQAKGRAEQLLAELEEFAGVHFDARAQQAVEIAEKHLAKAVADAEPVFVPAEGSIEGEPRRITGADIAEWVKETREKSDADPVTSDDHAAAKDEFQAALDAATPEAPDAA